MQKNKWIGSPKGLKKRIIECGFSIVDTKKHNGALTFRTSQGGIVNWWETTKTVQFQGKPDEQKKLSENLKLDFEVDIRLKGRGGGVGP